MQEKRKGKDGKRKEGMNMDPECVIITSKLVLLVIIAAKNLISKHKKNKMFNAMEHG